MISIIRNICNTLLKFFFKVIENENDKLNVT